MDDELERATKRLKSAVDDHHTSLGEEIQKIDDEEKRLKDRLHKIHTKKQECAAENGISDVSDDDLIEINAGGKIIAAKRGVLCRIKGTRLEAFFGGRWDKYNKLLRDSTGRVFFDVNPKAFRAIVDWLNVLAISSEDDCPQAPTAAEDYKHVLNDHMKLFVVPLTNFGSKIINSVNEKETIQDWLREDGSDGRLNLLYRSSIDGLSAEAFHKVCDNRGRTLVLIETTEGVVGGYSNTPWDSKSGNRPANKAFLFALSGFGLSSPCKRKLKNADDEWAIFNGEDWPIFDGENDQGQEGPAPAFGGGCDLAVDESDVALYNGCSYVPFETVQLPEGEVKRFPIKEMEVFQVSEMALPRDPKQKSPTISPKKLPTAAVDRFSEGVNDAINERWATLQKLEEEVISLEESLEDEHRFIDLFACGSVNDVVMLNVGGTNMVTKRATLLAVEESMLAQQFHDTKWTEHGSNNSVRVKEWTPVEVSNWAKSIEGMQEDVSGIFLENSINGLELLALNEFGLEKVGVKRAGTICLLLKEIKQLEKATQDVVTFIEHSPYCFGKLLDFLRWKHLNSVGLTTGPAPPSVCEHKRELFEKMIRYYFPGDSSKLILG